LPTWFVSRMRTTLFKLIFIFVIPVASYSQEIVSVPSEFKSLSLLPGLRVIKSNESSPKRALEQFQKGEGEVPPISTLGYVGVSIWAHITLQNAGMVNRSLLLELNNPQMDYMNVFLVRPDTLLSLGETGDMFAFRQRPLPHRNFVYPINFQPGETKELLLLLDKKASSIDIPLFLWTPEAHASRDYKYNIGYGLFFGFLALCFIYAFLTYLSLIKRIYLWYSLYILVMMIYLFANVGLASQFLYPWAVDVNSMIHVCGSISIFVLFFFFSKEFLPFRSQLPRVNIVLNIICYFFLGSIVVCFFTYPDIKNISVWVMPFFFMVLLVGHIILTAAAFYLVRKFKRDATIFLAAIFVMFVLGSIQTLRPFGINFPISTDLNLVMVGSALEIFIFSLGLTAQIRKINDERNMLLVKMAHQQKELLKAYVDGVEKERERISRELHDDLGSRLGSLKRFVTNIRDHSSLEKQIDTLCEDVRTMSHQLSPSSMKIAGFRQQLHELVFQIHQGSGAEINLQFYDVPENLPEEVAHHLYRITQEAINNSIKHGRATEIDVQLFGHQGELVLTIDDNGRGFTTDAVVSGIGIKNMKARVASLNGTFEISSSESTGTSILVQAVFLSNT
jgi:signal transduction histidine kinase